MTIIGADETHETQDAQIKVLANEYESALRNTAGYWTFMKATRKKILQSLENQNDGEPCDMADLARTLMNQGGEVCQLVQNSVAMAHARRKQCGLASSDHSVQGALAKNPGGGKVPLTTRVLGWSGNDVVASVEAGRKKLESTAKKRLNRIAVDMGMPLVRRRTAHEEAMILSPKHEHADDALATPPCLGLPSRGVRDPERICLQDDQDILEALQSIPAPHDEADHPCYGHTNPTLTLSLPAEFTKFWTKVPALLTGGEDLIARLRKHFANLSSHHPHVGVDDWIAEESALSVSSEAFLQVKVEEAEKILACRDLEAAKDFAQRGIPACIRSKLWDLILQSDFVESQQQHTKSYCRQLKLSIARHELLIDRIIQVDARQCRNEDSYFVFEDLLRNVMMYWIRDEWIARRIGVMPSEPVLGGPPDSSKENSGIRRADAKAYPPNGVLPTWGVSCFAMPFCYLHDTAEAVYMTFREFYVRYFHDLHTLSVNPQSPTLPTLCKSFESLLKQQEPYLFFHLTHHLNLPPISFAARWIMYAFVGVLDVEQVLLLWDRILGFGTQGLELLAVAAAAIFMFKADMLLKARHPRDVEYAFSDFGAIRIIPLLQHFIFDTV
ncbi:hypothetical protein DFS34DRAFT_648017 [Phlyctochytrium arcticum]|nr:hypothetical protein DFS34DRAFT_648017 [Phlyctochytrium arcticum]